LVGLKVGFPNFFAIGLLVGLKVGFCIGVATGLPVTVAGFAVGDGEGLEQMGMPYDKTGGDPELMQVRLIQP